MGFLLSEEVENYVERHTSKPATLFADLKTHTYEHLSLPQMQVGAVEGRFLKMLVQLTGAKRVLEIGTFTGYSALMMAEGLPEDGEVITCDVDEKATDVAQSFFDKSPHGKKIKIRLAPALETLKDLEDETFELIFIDADKTNYNNYFDEGLRLLKRGGLIVADNTLWSGRVLNPKDADDIALDAFNQKVCNDPRVENVLLSVRDGLMLARKV